MGKKNQVKLTVVSTSSESDTDSSSSSSEEESSPPAPSLPAAAKKSGAQKAMASRSESYDSDPLLNSIVSKPIDNGSKLKRPRSRPNSKPSPAETPIKPNSKPSPAQTPVKRPTAAAVTENSKKKKTENGEEEGKKSVLFQRLWSDDDEVAILKGMLEYKEKKGAEPMADPNDFHDFIKKSLHIDVDRKQVIDKVRRLKKRYGNSMEKRKNFNPHEKIVLELSKKIWRHKGESNDIAAKESPAMNGFKEAGGEKVGNPLQFIGKASVSMGLDESTVSFGLELCSEDKKAEIEEKWRKLHLESSDLFVRKLELARQESEMIIAALRSVRK